MKRAEAEKLIGKTFKIWTQANGEYVGKLLEVIPASPWRAKLEITGVLKCAVVWDIGRKTPRRGFRAGETIEAGHSSLKETDLEGTTYLQALENELATFEGYLAQSQQRLTDYGFPGKNTFHLKPTIEFLKQCIEAEKAAAIE